jgi:hypothetical protein
MIDLLKKKKKNKTDDSNAIHKPTYSERKAVSI